MLEETPESGALVTEPRPIQISAEHDSPRELRLSAAQSAVWYGQRIDRRNPMFNIALYLDVRGAVELTLLSDAFDAVLGETEALRARVLAHDEQPVQVLDAPGTGVLDVLDLRAEPDPVAAALDWMRAEHAQPLNPVRGGLYRAVALQVAEDRVLVYQRVHHLIMDGYGAALVLARTAEIYQALSTDSRPPECAFDTLAELLAEEDAYLAGAEYAADERYWLDRFADRPAASSPARRDEPMGNSFLRHSTEISEAERIELAGTARALGTGIAPLIVACFALYLHRVTGDRDVVFGLPVPARRTKTARVTPGMLSNILALRLRVHPETSIAELVRSASDEIRAALRHQRYRSERLRAELGAAVLDGPTINILPQQAKLPFGAHEASTHNLAVGPVEDLAVVVEQRAEGLLLNLDANPGRYTAEELAGHAERFAAVLRAAAADTGARAADVLLHEEFPLAAEYSATEPTIPDLFATRVAETPEATALREKTAAFSFRELDEWSNRFGNALAARGIGKGDTVAVLADRSCATIAALLGVFKSGARYLPVDPAYPAERIAFLLEDAEPALVLGASEPRPGGLSFTQCAAFPATPLRCPAPAPEDAAYLVYTSGSTGRPKGVVVEHGSLANLFAHQRSAMFDPARTATGSRARVAHLAGTAFDAYWDAVLWLADGHELVLLEDEVRTDPQACLDRLRQAGIDALGTTPSYLRQLLANGLLDGAGHPAVLFIGGEEIDPELWNRLGSVPGLLAVNLYGPTETCVDAVTARLAERETPAIGQPVRGMRAYVLDSSLRPAPAGMLGELYLSGPGLARGYHRRPGMTASAFLADPFAAESFAGKGSRMYRTGDLAVRCTDGSIEFAGRADRQVKIRGHRVEPGEVEAQLAALEPVDRAAVAVRGTEESRRLLAYVTPSTVDTSALAERLAGQLPAHLLPAQILAIAELPLTANGKLDRDRLPEPESAPATASAGHAEQVCRELFAEVLGLGAVGPQEDFFALGGHSLLATRLLGSLREALGVRLPIRALFESPTPAELAARIALGRTVTEQDRRRPALRRMQRGPRLPLSGAQRRLWFLHRMDAAGTEYHMPALLRCTGTLDLGALRAALGDLLTRHEALRTVFAEQDGEPYQRVLEAPEIALRCEHSTDYEHPQDCAARVRAELDRPFDLSTELPLRALLLGTGEHEHLLVLVIHHIAGDGWSFTPLARDLGTAYAARAKGREPEFEPLEVQYADYALWQAQLLGDRADPESPATRQLAFWTSALAALPEPELPLDHPRQGTRRPAAGSVPLELSPETHARIAELATAHGASTFMVLHAALAAWCHRIGAGNDIPIGTAIAGRTEPALAELVGLFVNTLVLRADLSGAPSFTELLRRIIETDLAAFEHQDLPFDQVVEALAPQRIPGRNPLFDVMFTLQNNAAAELELPGLTVSPTQGEPGAAKFDLSFSLRETFTAAGEPAGITGTLEYARDLFDAASADGFAATFTALTGELTGSPHRPVRSADLLGARTGSRLHGPDSALTGATVADLFAAQVRARPEERALVCGAVELTFAELDARAGELARLLAGNGVLAGQTVAVALPRSADTVAALLAVTGIGAVYLSVDIEYPDARIAYLLADARPAVVLCTRETAARFGADVPVLRTEQQAPEMELPAGPSAQDPAYLLYTSGSTGQPKGILVEHGSLENLLQNHRQRLFPAQRARVAHLSGVAFDAAWDPVLWLLDGHELHLIEERMRRDPEALLGHLDREGIDFFETTPSYVDQLVSVGLLESARPRILAVGGEAVEKSLWDRLAAAPRIRAVNMYGPTETCVDAVFSEIGEREHPAIGSPVPNTRAYVLDAGLHPVPAGVPGELYLAGPGLARGYHGRGGLTAERFLADPFACDGTRMYRTGDLVRLGPDGALEFLSRTDDQVKLRGFRIELAEIATVLSGAPGVAAARVLVHGRRLLGYVVGTGAEVDLDAVRVHAARALPEYMRPHGIAVLEEFPLTPNGKLDRDRLPIPEAPAGSGRAPKDAGEERLCALFAATLGLREFGVDQDFFAAGGHSLLVTKLISRIRAEFGVDLPLRTVFEAPTPETLAQCWSQARTAGPRLVPGPRPERIPLSYAQLRMWFLNDFQGADGGYNIAMAVTLRGQLDRAALHGAITEVFARHESLRTLYRSESGEPYQFVLGAELARPPLPLVDVEPEQLSGALATDGAEGFALERELPARAKLLRLGEREHVLLFVVHHIASDGASTAPLARDLAEAYRRRLGYAEPARPPLGVQYADYALWQRKALGGENEPDSPVRAQLDFWTRALAGLPEELALPHDRPRQANPAHHGGMVRFELSPETYSRITALASGHGASVFMVLHTCLAVLLSRLSGETDLAIGTPVAGRGDEALEDLVGLFVNTLALRTDLSGNPGFTELLARIRDGDLAAFDNQEVPFERVVEALAPARSLGRHPLFQVMLTLQNNARTELSLPGLDVEIAEFDSAGAAKFDLSLSFTERDAGLAGTLEFNADLFDAVTAREIADRFSGLVAEAVTAPEQAIGEFELTLPGERDRLSAAARGVRVLPEGATVVHEFERMAAQAPAEAISVVCEDEVLRTAELEAQANRITRLLRARGVRRGSAVAVAVPRSARTTVGMLAVLKAGAVYVPIDIGYPSERIEAVLADADPDLVLTETGVPLPSGYSRVELDTDPEDGFSGAELETERPRGADPAYLIHTSGSTGRPKGVLVPHTGLVNLLHQHRTELFGPDRLRVALTAAISFDASWDPFLWMVAGHELHILAERHRKDPEELVGYLHEQRIDSVEVTPTQLRQLDAAGLFGSAHSPSVVTVGGEAISAQGWTRLRDLDGVRAQNYYGPTETCVNAMAARIEHGDRPHLGHPIVNTDAHVLDARLRPVPFGVAGELYLAGAGIAYGYLNRTGMTAERFVANPFTAGSFAGNGTRMYRTGDRVRRLRDGTLEFLGRTDNQVKVRGFRIELGEVESALLDQPGITEAAVLVRGEALVAYVVTDTEDARWLRAALSRTLPEYMLPSVFVPVPALPLTPNGKLDQSALPSPGRSGEMIGPRSPKEDVLCRLFADALGLERVGIDESFFELGGHSLLASKLIAAVRETLGVRLSIRRLFEHPTVAGLADKLRDAGGDDSFEVLLPLRTTGSRPPLFCVHSASALSWPYAGLLRHLPGDQPLYGLQARKLSDPGYTPASLTEMALDYLEQIRRIQPHGPYHLLGWSLGGNIAHEMAVRLQESGERVALLTIVDSHPHACSEGLATVSEPELFQSYLRLQGHDVPEDWYPTRAEVRELYQRTGNPLGSLDEDAIGALVAAFSSHGDILNGAEIGTYHGPTLFFGTQEDSPFDRGWGEYLNGPVEHHNVPFPHALLMRPPALQQLGPVLARRLRTAQDKITQQRTSIGS